MPCLFVCLFVCLGGQKIWKLCRLGGDKLVMSLRLIREQAMSPSNPLTPGQ